MALDTLEVFGNEYTGVKGFKATDSNDTIKAYIRPQGTMSITANGTGIDISEYAAVDVAVSTPPPSLQSKSVSYTPSESSQSATITADIGYDGLDEVSVSVGAISPTYVGTGITRRTSADLTVSGDTVSAPSGYYESGASKAVASGTEGTPVATKSAASNNEILVTPSVTNTAGYIGGGTKTGTAVSVSASELVDGTLSISANGTGIDVTNYASVDVAVEGSDTLVQALHNQVTSVSDDTLTSIRSYGLASMSALTSVSFPNLQTINTYAFYNDANLVMNGWIFPSAKTIGNYAFRYCYGLTGDVVLPSTVTSIGQYSFASCKNIETFTAKGSITTFGTYTFAGASADHKMTVREIYLPNLGTSIALNLNFGSATAAYACQQLEIIDIGKAKSIAANTFANCYKLQTLIMRRTSVTTCANVSAFLNTPLRGYSSRTADIYVPSSLIESYKAASVWTTINGYGYVTWHELEGSPYETP